MLPELEVSLYGKYVVYLFRYDPVLKEINSNFPAFPVALVSFPEDAACICNRYNKVIPELAFWKYLDEVQWTEVYETLPFE